MSEHDLAALASDIAARVTAATSLRVAFVGLAGSVIGALVIAGGTLLLYYFQDRPRRELDRGRKEILLKMLRDEGYPGRWRNISTMSRVVGADEEVTKRLLIEVGARGSEKDDGLWGLIEYHPLDQVDQ